MLCMLTFTSLGGKPDVHTEKIGAVNNRISSKLARAKTESQRRYVIAERLIARQAHYIILLIRLKVPITDPKTRGEEGRAKEMISTRALYSRAGLLSEQILYIDVTFQNTHVWTSFEIV